MKRIALLALPILLLAAAAEAAPLRVITWNIHHGLDIDNRKTVDAQAEWLASLDPHIVMLQEVEQFSASYGNFDHVARIQNVLQERTGRTFYSFWVNNSGTAYGRGQVTAILSSFPLLSPLAKRMPYSRPLTMANVEVLPGKVIGLFTVHLASWQGYDRERATQVAELVYWVTVRGTSVRLLGGDWNATPASVPLAPIHYWYHDLYQRATATGVFTGPEDTRPVYRSNSVVGRIDALFLGKRWPSWMTLTRMDHVDTGLSDHFAVFAQFEIR